MYFMVITGIEKHDSEGRVITAEFEKFFLVTSCKLSLYSVCKSSVPT